MAAGSRMAFTAVFLGRRLAYTYEVSEFVPGERLVRRTSEGPFPMETAHAGRMAGRARRWHVVLINNGKHTIMCVEVLPWGPVTSASSVEYW
jgi:hypothetical protein